MIYLSDSFDRPDELSGFCFGSYHQHHRESNHFRPMINIGSRLCHHQLFLPDISDYQEMRFYLSLSLEI